MAYQATGMNKAIADGQRLVAELAAAQMAQGRAIYDVAARVRALEQKRS